MKLSIRSKVANGLVLCLMTPAMAATSNQIKDNIEDGLDLFSASDDFDLAADNGTLFASTDQSYLNDDPSGGDPSGGDPSGGDPSGGDPSACVPQTAPQKIEFSTTRDVTAIDSRTSDSINVCILSEKEPAEIGFDVSGPQKLEPGETGVYLVRLINKMNESRTRDEVIISATGKLAVQNYMAAMLSGEPFESNTILKPGSLQFNDLTIPASDTLMVSLEVKQAFVLDPIQVADVPVNDQKNLIDYLVIGQT